MKSSNKGFTLIEIIVVLIILGVLVMIAVPAYFNWVQRSQSAEAMISIGSIKAQFLSCIRSKEEPTQCFPIGSGTQCTFTFTTVNASTGEQVQGPIDRCTTWAEPGSLNFLYLVSNWGVGREGDSGEYIIDLNTRAWTVDAYRKDSGGQPEMNNHITVSGNAEDNHTFCGGFGLFQGVC